MSTPTTAQTPRDTHSLPAAITKTPSKPTGPHANNSVVTIDLTASEDSLRSRCTENVKRLLRSPRYQLSLDGKVHVISQPYVLLEEIPEHIIKKGFVKFQKVVIERKKRRDSETNSEEEILRSTKKRKKHFTNKRVRSKFKQVTPHRVDHRTSSAKTLETKQKPGSLVPTVGTKLESNNFKIETDGRTQIYVTKYAS